MPKKEREYKTYEDSKLIPPGTELVPVHFSGQATHYFLRYIDTQLSYSDLPRTETGKLLMSRKDITKLTYGTGTYDRSRRG